LVSPEKKRKQTHLQANKRLPKRRKKCLHRSFRFSESKHTLKENRKSQAQFVCESCQFSLNADINAARNILAVGYQLEFIGQDY